MQWFIVHTYSGYEQKVKTALEERIKSLGKEDLFEKILVPTEKVVELVKGERKTSARKFYPGYILVRMEMNDETWHLVKDVPKVMGFIGGTGDRPAPISDKEADAILQRMQEGVDKPKPKVLFEPGEVVKIDKLNLKRARLDLFLTLAEPLLVAHADGPFELYDETECQVKLMIDVPRPIIRGGKPQAVMVHVNVGLANAAMGVLNAASDIPAARLSTRLASHFARGNQAFTSRRPSAA